MTRRLLSELDAALLRDLDLCWPVWARDDQLPPDGDAWRVWLILGGRGAGKTRAGAEWVRSLAMGGALADGVPARRIALVGETAADVRNVMVEGVSGILAVHRHGTRPDWQPSRWRLVWPNGAVAELFSADEPDQLRGPQFDAAWADEVGKWRHAADTFDMLQMTLRIGSRPRLAVTTTPRRIALIRRMLDDPATVVSRAATRANSAHLAEGFLAEMERRYGGTSLGRQELDGELLEDRDDALWTRAIIEAQRVGTAPPLARIVVAIDPPASASANGSCGLVAVGIAGDGHLYVLADRTIAAARPAQWAAEAVALYHRLGADRLVAEVNQGGDMVEAVLREIDNNLPVTKVRATHGKWVRAEPVAALYEQGRVSHVGRFPALEDQLCDFTTAGLSDGRSPDRLDALVWAVSSLSVLKGAPRIRGFS